MRACLPWRALGGIRPFLHAQATHAQQFTTLAEERADGRRINIPALQLSIALFRTAGAAADSGRTPVALCPCGF